MPDYPVDYDAELGASAILVITGKCPLKCSDCYGKGFPRKDADADSLPLAMSHLRQLGYDTLWVSGGEPTLHPEFARIVREASGHFRRVNVTTSGVSMQATPAEAAEVFREHYNFPPRVAFQLSANNELLRQHPDHPERTAAILEGARLAGLRFPDRIYFHVTGADEAERMEVVRMYGISPPYSQMRRIDTSQIERVDDCGCGGRIDEQRDVTILPDGMVYRNFTAAVLSRPGEYGGKGYAGKINGNGLRDIVAVGGLRHVLHDY